LIQDAIDASLVDWSEVTRLVLVDSRWKHARAVVEDPKLQLKQLPAMKPETQGIGCSFIFFWGEGGGLEWKCQFPM
jgi:hypothetical protein